MIGSPKCRAREREERDGAKLLSEIILPNAVEHRNSHRLFHKMRRFAKLVWYVSFLFFFCFFGFPV